MKPTYFFKAVTLVMMAFSACLAQASSVEISHSFRIPQKRQTSTAQPQRKPGVELSIPASIGSDGDLELYLDEFECVEQGFVQVLNLKNNLGETIKIPKDAETVSIRLNDLPSTYVINVSVNDQLFSGTYFFTN